MFGSRTRMAMAALAAAMFAVSAGMAGPATQTAGKDAAVTRPAATTTTPTATRPKVPAPKPAAPKPAAPEPAPKPAAPAPKPALPKINFQFKRESYRDVIRFMARAANKPVLGNVDAVQGTLTYFDASPYSFDEAMGIVNEVLLISGVRLVDKGRYLRLITLPEVPLHTKILQGMDDAKLLPGDQIITTIVPLQFLDASQAVSLVARMVPRYGTLSPLEKGKGIIITSSVSNIRRIQRLLGTVDKGSLTERQLKYYPLKNAPAADAAKLVQALFGSAATRRYVYNAQRRRYVPAAPDPSETVTVTADARSNMLVVLAATDKHKLIEEMIAKIDVDEPIGEGAIRIVELKSAKAEDLAKTLASAVGYKTVVERDSRNRPRTRRVSLARIVADPATNRLIISAAPDVMKQLDELIEKLDAGAVSAGVRIFPLKVANASSLIGVVQGAFGKRDNRGRIVTNFLVTADSRTNSLIVNGPVAEMDGIAKLIEKLDQQIVNGGKEVHVVRLTAGDARETARALMQVLAPQARGRRGRPAADESIRIEADRGTNSLIIAAAPGDWQRIKATLDKLTQGLDQVTVSTRIFPLKHSRAADVAGVISQVFDPRRRRVPRGRPQPVPVIVTADNQSNSLLVSATAEDIQQVEKMLKAIDVPPAEAATIEVRCYALTNASAQEIARSLGRLFAGRRARGRGGSSEPQPRFEAETNSNQLVVAATGEQFKMIDALIKQMLETAGAAKTVVKLFPLKHAKADQLAAALQRVVQADIAAAQRRSASRRGRSDFQISVDGRTNSLLVTAPAETMKIIEELVPKLDSPDTVVQVTKVVELANADPSELATAINAALAGQAAPAGRGRRGQPPVNISGLAGKMVIVVPEQSARAVLLTGKTEDVAFAEKLIMQIDARPSVQKATIKPFKLTHAKAEDVARVLNATVGQMGRGRRGAVPTRISADKTSNSIVVSAGGDVLERIAELLKELDVEGAGEGAVTIEIVKLKKAKADDLAAALNAAQGQAARGPRRRADDDEDVVRVTADAPSNSLLLTGRPEQIAETKKLITSLDESVGQLTSVMRIFPLRRAKAADLLPVMERILRQQVGRRGRGAPTVDIRIASQDKANSIVVHAPPEVVALAEQLVKEFDAEAGAETVIQIVPLTKAEATTLATAVNQALAAQAGPRGRGAAPGAVVVPEGNSNSLLVRGNKLDVEKAVTLIKQLDEGGAGVGTQVRVFPLVNAEAGPVAKTIDALFRQIVQQQRRRGRGAPPPASFSVAADERTNSLIISTSQANFAVVDALLEKLDQDADVVIRDMQYIPLLHANAFDLVDKIDAMFADRKKGDRPTVAADELSNGLTIIAKDADFRAIEAVVSKFDEVAIDTYIQVRVIPISGGTRAEKIAEVLKRVYEQVSGGEVQITDKLPPRARGGLDEGMLILPAPDPTVLLAPEKAKPAEAPAEPTTPPAEAEQPAAKPAGRPPVIVAVDKGSNCLIISAAQTEMTDIELLIEQLAQTSATEEAETEVFKVKNADPVSLAKTLNALFNPKRPQVKPPAQPRRGRQQQPTAAPVVAPKPKVVIAADPRTRSIIVRAKPVEMDMIGKLIKQLDLTPEVSSEIRIIPLEHADATEVAQNISQLFQIAGATAAPAKGKKPTTAKSKQLVRTMLELRTADGVARVDDSAGVTITANRRTNSVIVVAPSDAMEVVVKLITELDQGQQPAAMAVKIFKIEHAEVSDVVNSISQIFRSSRTGGTRQRGGAAAAAQGATAMAVAGNEASRTVIVSARVDQLPLIEKTIKELDEASKLDAATVKVYRIKYSDARSVATALTQALTQAATGRARRGRTAPSGSLRISPDASSNAIVIRGSASDHERVAELILELDQETSKKATFRTIKLARTDAREVVNGLNRMLWSWPRKPNEPRPAVAYSRNTNTLMISGSESHVEMIGKMVTELEAGKQEKSRVQFFQPEFAGAAEVANSLSRFYGPRATDPAARTVTISVDDRTNTLMVAAQPEQAKDIAALIGKLDVEDSAGEARRVVIALTHAQADTVARAITQAFRPLPGRRVSPSDLVVATAEPGTNTVIVAASAKNLKKIESLIKEIDSETTGTRTMEFMILTNAKATDLARVLGQVVGRQARGRAATQPPTVAGDAGSNAIVMTGTKAEVDELMKMAKLLDAAAMDKTTTVQVITLEKADAVTTADTVNQLLQAQARELRRARKSVEPVAITADARTNSLIVAASDETFQMVSQLVNKIDAMSPARGKVQVIPLKDADPNDVLKAIQQLYGSGAAPRIARGRSGRPAGGPQATVLSGQRAVLLNNFSKEDLEAIQTLVDAMEKAAASARQEVLVFPLTNATNTKIAQALNVLFRAAVRPGHPEDRVVVMPLQGTNAVVVTASKEKMEEVSGLIKQLDGLQVVPKIDYKVFPLVNSSATKILPLVNQMIQPLRQARPTQRINITADARSNAIVVATAAPVMDEIASIVKTLDAVPAFKAADVIILPLKNADAPSLAAVLTDILTPGTSRIQTPEARALQEQVRLLRMVKGHEGLPLLDLSKPIKITSDPARSGQPGSNSLIISSTAENLQAMAEIVALLDTLPVAAGLKVQILHLKNADPINTMNLLREIFAQGRGLAGRPRTPTVGRAVPEGVVGEALTNVLNVTADARTNALILSGTEETVALAMVLVKDIDAQPTSEFTEVKVIKLAHADAVALAGLIRGVFAEGPARAPGVEGARAYVTKLKVLREKAAPVSSKVARTHPTLVVQAERNTNVLIIAARSDLMPIITEMVKTMDIPGAGSLNVVRIYPLKNADATRMASVVNGLYTGPNQALIRPEDRPTIAVDTRTNALVVSSSEKTFAMIDALLLKLDAKLPIELRDIRLLPLKNADAITLAPTLQRMMDARVQRQQSLGVGDAEALRMIIVPDARSNYLIVGGSAEGYKLVQDLAAKLDDAPAALAGKIQLIPLVKANAGTLSVTLNNLFNQRYQAARTPDVQRQKPVIVPDLRTNTLMVAAGQDDSRVVTALVKQLDRTLADPAVQLVVEAMKFNDAGTVGPMIQQIFADRLRAMTPPGQQIAPQDVVSVAIEPLSNSLVISASKENLEMIRALLKKVDVEPPTDTGVVKMFPLKYTDVQRIASMLQGLVAQGLYKPALVGAPASRIIQAREKVAITSDLRTNVLIVSASKENLAILGQIIDRVDVKEGWGLTGNINVFPLKNADATRLGPVIQQMFDRKRAAEAVTGGTPRSLPVVVVADERTNALLVAASKESFDEITKLLERLDAKDVVRNYEFDIFYLKRASAASLQSTLRQLFAQRVVRGAPQPVTIIADPKANALIIGASRDDIAIAKSLIARLDKEAPKAGFTLKAFPVVKADATQVGTTLQRLFDAQRPTGGESGVTITVDERSNTLIVAAAQADMERIGELIKKLDTAPVTDVTEIRIFTLRHADAAQLAQILTAALTNKPTQMTAASQNRATLLRLIAKDPDGKELIGSALKRGIMITPVARTNSLLIQAPVETMPLLGKLVKALDTVHPRSAEIHVYPLINADATQMQRVLTDLFRLQVANTQRQAARYRMATTAPAGGDEASPAATLGSAEQTVLSITVDERTNSLLVAGTEEYVSLVGRVIEQLDSSPAEDRQSLVYRLRYAQATDIETALRSFLDQERQRLVSTLGANAVGAAKELLSREIAIVAEGTSNTLLISGSPRFFKTVTDIVRQLDQPPPQVLVQVLLAEVTLDDTTEFGITWNYTRTPGQNTTVQAATTFGLPATGFSFSVSGKDLTMLVRALQSQGRLEVLSRPQIVATDNKPATINIGKKVPFVESQRVTEAGSVFNTISKEPVGIILELTPRISPDGFVMMDVSPEISSLSESSVKISEDVNAPIINSRSADTTVTVQDGHTIVIGGLITTKEQNREEKIPLLGDIPLLGLLFKSTKIVKERTELLIVLTPHILRAPTDSDVMTNQEILRLTLTQGLRDSRKVSQLLNPLRHVTPMEVKRLERGAAKGRHDNYAPVVIPLIPARESPDKPVALPEIDEDEYK